MKKWLLLGLLFAVSCEYNITQPSPIVNVTTTNTNTNTNNPNPGGGNGGENGGSNQPLPLPTYGPEVLPTVPTALLATSCTDFAFLDALVAALKQRGGGDPRWGYSCRNTNCTDISRDVIAYKATNTTTGVHLVDVIGGVCGPNPTAQWLPLGFAANGTWAATHP